VAAKPGTGPLHVGTANLAFVGISIAVAITAAVFMTCSIFAA
jgi:hypothetical protein